MIEHITDALTIPNQEKIAAKKQQQWGWQSLPDSIRLYEIHTYGEGDHWLVMPRGFAKTFAEGMRSMGYEIEWEDARQWTDNMLPHSEETQTLPRGWQADAIESILTRQQGIYKAPAGSGKTVAILHAMHFVGRKSLVIVNTKDILWQWQERVREHLGDYEVGQVGDNTFEVADFITIATAQTLHRRFNQLENSGFFDEFSFVCLDECHHATAETYNRILNRFSARFRVGVSATPDKTGDFALATNVLGPVIHETKPSEVTTLQKPEVVRIPTQFTFGFRPTRNQWQRSNYPQMIQALVRNPERNALIVKAVMENEGHHQLVLSKRLEHLDLLEAMLQDAGLRDPIIRITGQEKNEDRQQAKALVESEPSVLLSTLADEAMDIPRLDRLHLAFPQRNSGLVTQQVGRVERVHPDKKDALIFDYCDLKIGPLENQWRTRKREVYGPRGYKITTRKADSFG